MIPFHPLADIFPLIEGEDFEALVADIREHGLRESIVLIDQQILDGRNRYRACVAAGLIPEDAPGHAHLKFFRFYAPAGSGAPSHDELVAFVISKNLRRRQLNESQRAMVAAKLADISLGGNQHSEGTSIEGASTLLNVGRASVERAKAVQRDGTSELQHKVETGELRISTAAMIARLPKDEQVKLLREAAPAALKAAAKEIRAEKQIEKKERRDEKEQKLGTAIRALPDIKAGLIISDFEWHFQVRSEETGMDRHAANHYVTASDSHTPEQIVERQRDRMSIAADNCIHLMWCPASFNAIALKVMDLQGFRYVSQFVWIKPGIGTGFWVRDCHELLLIGVRGVVPCPAMGDQFKSAIEAPKGEHSEKPDFQYEIAEHYFPSLPKIELNARRYRKGWIQWGNEAPKAEDEAA